VARWRGGDGEGGEEKSLLTQHLNIPGQKTKTYPHEGGEKNKSELPRKRGGETQGTTVGLGD